MNTYRFVLYQLIADAVIMIVMLLIINSLPIPTLVPCTYPPAQNIGIALCVSLAFHFLVINRIWLSNSRLIVLIYTFLLALILILGSYTLSPLGFSTGRISVLRGFKVTRFGRPAVTIASGDIVSIPSNSVTEMTPITITGSITCFWASTNGGYLDDPGSCDVVYLSPPGADFDKLKVLVQPGCRMPVANGEIRISIMP